MEFVSNVYRVDHTKVIQCNVRDITSRKLAEASLQRANDKLSSVVATLRHRDGEMTLLNHMNELLQTCETQEEAYRVIPMIAAELFAGQSGCLAVFHGSGQYLETMARWGDGTPVENVFPMKDCWAIRRGRPHEVVDPKTSLLCEHFVRPPERGYLCLPLTVQGETLGIFYLDAALPGKDDHPVNQRQLAVMTGETIKLSLANLKLQKTLHEQATRDPLTGSFNRRYLNETLPRELHGALRRDAHLCLVMIDLDHFKRFNDTFGHDTGDLVLREAGRLLRENLRKSDIACRYGGEEFVLVLPGSSLADAMPARRAAARPVREARDPPERPADGDDDHLGGDRGGPGARLDHGDPDAGRRQCPLCRQGRRAEPHSRLRTAELTGGPFETRAEVPRAESPDIRGKSAV